jgi:hypothetical protein
MEYTPKTVNLQEAVKDLNARLQKLENMKPVATPPAPPAIPAAPKV